MSDELFSSGPWVGFYNYRPGDRHRMDLDLAFDNGVVSGDGNDDVGRFLIKGRYTPSSGECHWTKSYLGAHQVSYRGFREGKGIWGTWEISLFAHGGFRIWPRTAGEGETIGETAEHTEPVAAVAGPATDRLKIVKAGGGKPEVLHQASPGECMVATPALVGTRINLRTETKLYAFKR